jgi:viroplasmin and RNaseH domain-containing protein
MIILRKENAYTCKVFTVFNKFSPFHKIASNTTAGMWAYSPAGMKVYFTMDEYSPQKSRKLVITYPFKKKKVLFQERKHICVKVKKAMTDG